MRVVGGEAKGRRLKGTISAQGRPTTERVRAAIFNILPAEVYQGLRVLDLYAGSGSLGIEALSRGAGWADFVEHDRRQCGVLRDNLEHTGFSSRAGVHCSDAMQSLAWLSGPYGLVLLDPPYRLGDLAQVLERAAARAGLIAPGGMVVAGHSRHSELLPSCGSLSMVSHRRYGDNVVDFFRQGGRGWPPPSTPAPSTQ